VSDITIGNQTYTGTWTGTIYQNECGSLFGGASGTLHRVGCRLYNYATSSDVTASICVWDSSGTLLGYGNTTIPGSWNSPLPLEVDLITPVAVSGASSYLLGVRWVRNGSSNITHGILANTPLNFNYKDGGGGYPPPALTGVNTDYLTGCFWAYVTPGAAPDKPLTESYGIVASTTPTIRLYAHTSDAGQITGMQFVITGTSPAHGPATITASGGPWASGTWVSYTLAPGDLGWTPAAGDTLTYHGIASSIGGSTTGNESTPFIINSTSLPTITSPVATGYVASLYVASDKIGANVVWTFTDPQAGDTQSAYQVKLYADSAGSKGTLLTGADTGKVTSSAGSCQVIPTAGLSNKTYYWVGVTTWDSLNASSGEQTMRFRAAWARYDGRHNFGATPAAWQIPIVSALVPANTSYVVEWGSTVGATYPPATWYSDANWASVPLNQYLHYRFYLFGWGAASPSTPTVQSISFSTVGAGILPDGWTRTDTQCTMDRSVAWRGTQSFLITATGAGGTVRAWKQSLTLLGGQTYILGGRLKFVKAGGSTSSVYFDIYDGATSYGATAAVTTSTDTTANPSGFQTCVGSVFTCPGAPGDAVAMTFRMVMVDGGAVAASTVNFDGVQLNQGSVFLPWDLAAVGAAGTVDQGGVQMNGAAGAVVRLLGSAGATTDIVQLGGHGLTFGGGPEIYSPDGVNLNIGGSLALMSGGTLPAQPAYGNNRPFFYTAAGYNEVVYYDGTRWLTQGVYVGLYDKPRQADFNPIANNFSFDGLFPDPTRSIYMLQLYGWFYVDTTNDGTHYWTFTDAATAITMNTSAMSINTWTKLTATVNTVVAPATMNLAGVKTSTPGGVYVIVGYTYRKIAT
jgi:hypothetical protein